MPSQQIHYDILEISSTATEEDIRRAYHRLALRWHPDKNLGDPSADEKFKEVNNAYKVLLGVDERREYDMYGAEDNSRRRRKRSPSPSFAHQDTDKKPHLEPWHRRPAPALDPKEDALVFQQTTIEWGFGKDRNPSIRMYGVTENGNSVLCHVNGFFPYAYFSVPDSFCQKDLNVFRRRLGRHLGNSFPVRECKIVKKRTVYGYVRDKTKFIKVTLTDPHKIRDLKDAFPQYEIFESNLDFVLRFMIDKDIVGMSWIELPRGSYTQRPSQDSSRCQYEVDVFCDRIVSHPANGRYSSIAPLRILSFDIECTGLAAKNHKVFQIASVLSVHGEAGPQHKFVFTLKKCSDIKNVTVRSFENEKSLLEAWSEFVVETDPDLFTGYNINGFDFPFMMERAELLGVTNFLYFGREAFMRCQAKTKETTTSAYGTRKTTVVTVPGRVSFDICEIVKRDHKLPSYKLNFVSDHFLEGEKKVDLPYDKMFRLYRRGRPKDMMKIAVYCLKDAELPLLLIDKLMCLPNYVEMARVTGVSLLFLMTRGQQIKVMSKIYRAANAEDYVIPVLTKSVDEDDGYEGATVINPKKGFYDVNPIAVLDFSSLYPSIMMAHNLCFTTLIPSKTIEEEGLPSDDGDYIVTPGYSVFVKPSWRKGLLPRILEDIIAARKMAKDELKKEKDPSKKAVLEGRQLALKIVANSVYGFTGALKGYLPCQDIASSVTAYGREMIKITSKTVEETFTMKNGYKHDAKVIYGDTDSVMVKFGSRDLTRVMDLSREATNFVNTLFDNPINLEFEKVYFPFLLIGKKRYVGLEYTDPNKPGKMGFKGLATVRRDRCRWVQDVMKSALDRILVRRDVQGSIDIVRNAVKDLRTDEADRGMLTFTGGWGKSEYKVEPPHVACMKRMMRRNPGEVKFGPGDRITYVVVAGAKGSRVGSRAEDPIYAAKNGLPIDVKYYHDALKRSVMDIFEPILGDEKKVEKTLFDGDHMNRVVRPPIKLLSSFEKAGFTVIKPS